MYFGGGYMVYDRLSKVAPPEEASLANTPVDFKATSSIYADFDTSRYEMSSYQDVSFPSRQANITLSGWYIEVDPDAPVIVVTHGSEGGSKRDDNALIPAGMLAHNGFNVLLYDMRNHGDSDRDNGRTSVGNKEYKDLLGAWDWLVQVKGFTPERIGVYGFSLGAATTLIAFGEEPRVAAAFVDSPVTNLPELMDAELARNHYPTFLSTPAILMARLVTGEDLLAHSPTEAIYNASGRPLYVVHGTGDTRISVNQTRELAALARQTNTPITVWMPDGVDHVESAFAYPAEYERRMVDFFKMALK
jgi:dipeptidyl aminopeptidase/acylaminoacyl peptidase